MYMSSFLLVSFLFALAFIYSIGVVKETDKETCLGFGCGSILLSAAGMIAAGFVFGRLASSASGAYPVLYEPERWIIGVSVSILTPLVLLWARYAVAILWNYVIKPEIEYARWIIRLW